MALWNRKIIQKIPGDTEQVFVPYVITVSNICIIHGTTKFGSKGLNGPYTWGKALKCSSKASECTI